MLPKRLHKHELDSASASGCTKKTNQKNLTLIDPSWSCRCNRGRYAIAICNLVSRDLHKAVVEATWRLDSPRRGHSRHSQAWRAARRARAPNPRYLDMA